ncbi:hypothetical protein ACIBEJ_16280 [Nonomuraea sp. NPDC050790]|uniref:hypothetical protein n=1 Tax=Nonomuraea sp. NPDC050790 TaxID=3364371 RepID=UPI0037B00E75
MRPADGGSPPPSLELAPNWPGLDGYGDHDGPHIDHVRVKQILKVLREDLGALRAKAGAISAGGGTPADLKSAGKVGPAQIGTWETANYFGQNAEQAYEVLSGKYLMLIDHVEKLVAGIEKAVLNYEKGHRDSSA